MNKKIGFEDIKKYLKEKYDVEAKTVEHMNIMQNKKYFVICEKEADFAIFVGNKDGTYKSLNGLGEELDSKKIFGYVTEDDVVEFDFPDIPIFKADAIHLSCRGSNIEAEDIISNMQVGYDMRTPIVLKTTPPGYLFNGKYMNFYVDELLYADEDEFEEIACGQDSEFLNYYGRNRNYESFVDKGLNGFVVFGKNNDGILVNSKLYDKHKDCIIYLPEIRSSVEKKFEECMQMEASEEIKVEISEFTETDGVKQTDGAQYFNDIREMIDEYIKALGEPGLAKGLKNSKVRNKVYSIKPEFETGDDVIMGSAVIKTIVPLTDEEIHGLKEYIEDSLSEIIENSNVHLKLDRKEYISDEIFENGENEPVMGM